MSSAALIVNTPNHADDWPAWTDEFRFGTTEDYPGLSGPQILLVQLFEQAARLRIDMPSLRECAVLLHKSISTVRDARRCLFYRSWIEEQPIVRLGQYRRPPRKRYRLTQSAYDRMLARDAKAKGGQTCIAS